MLIDAFPSPPMPGATINVFPDTVVAPCWLRDAIQLANTDTFVGGCGAASGTDPANVDAHLSPWFDSLFLTIGPMREGRAAPGVAIPPCCDRNWSRLFNAESRVI